MAGLKKCLGVDLGTNAVKIVELTYDKKGIKATRVGLGEVSLEASATVEEQRRTIVSTFKDVLKKNKFTCREAVFAIPGQKVFIRRFPLPASSPERLNRIVAYEARQQIPFDIDKTDLQWQFFDIPGSDEVEVLLVAVRLDEIKSYMSLVNKCGVKAVAVAVTSLALFNAQTFFDSPAQAIMDRITGSTKKDKPAAKGKKKGLGLSFGKKKKGAEEEIENENTVDVQEENSEESFEFDEVKGFVNIGAGAMDLIIASQNAKNAYLKFPRSVPAGGNDITRAIIKACSVSSFLDAERIKKHQTHLKTANFDPSDGDINIEACDAATKATDRIVSELRKSLDFFISQPDGMAVDSLVISGGQANLEGMADYIEEKLAVPVEVRTGAPEAFPFQWPEDITMTDYVVATGLALQGIGQGNVVVDFLPEERKISRDFPIKIVAILVILFGLSVALLSQAGRSYTTEYRNQASNIQQILDRNAPLVSARTSAQARRDQAATLYTNFSQLTLDRLYWFRFLEQISSVKPAAVVINQITMEHDGKIIIIGVSETQSSSAAFNKALNQAFPDADPSPEILGSSEVRGPSYGFPETPVVFLFRIEFKVADKLNRLEVTPTPLPNLTNNPNQPNNNFGRPNTGRQNRPGRPTVPNF
ncbi:MAG: pilus assembly protein PilM [Sumerlaeia bacterium]